VMVDASQPWSGSFPFCSDVRAEKLRTGEKNEGWHTFRRHRAGRLGGRSTHVRARRLVCAVCRYHLHYPSRQQLAPTLAFVVNVLRFKDAAHNRATRSPARRRTS
jgi:hypothetical protein